MMSRRTLAVVLVALSLANSACGQKKPALVSKTAATNPFQQVAVPDSVLRRINQAIKRQEQLEADAFPLYVFNLLDRKNFVFQDGIYTYRLSSPHAKQRFFIVHKGATTILEGVFVDDVLREYLNFIDTKMLPEATSIRYLKAIAGRLDELYKSEHE